MTKRVTIVLALCMGLMFVFSGCSSKSGKYDKAKEMMENGQYSEAAEVFSTISDYEDSQELYNSCMYEQGKKYISENNYTDAKACLETILDYKDASGLVAECDHMIAVKNDSVPPTVTGINEGDVIELKFDEDFNLKSYLDGAVKIEDDVTKDISYDIVTTAAVYDKDNGKVNTLEGGTYDFTISTADEAGNKSAVNFSVHVDATAYITEETEFPVVLYAGELGNYYLNSIVHYSNRKDSPIYTEGYFFEMEFENGTDANAYCYLGNGYLNDYRILMYTDFADKVAVAPGKKGYVTSNIRDEDIDDKMADFEKIECTFYIADDQKTEFFSRPMLIDKGVVSFE